MNVRLYTRSLARQYYIICIRLNFSGISFEKLRTIVTISPFHPIDIVLFVFVPRTITSRSGSKSNGYFVWRVFPIFPVVFPERIYEQPSNRKNQTMFWTWAGFVFFVKSSKYITSVYARTPSQRFRSCTLIVINWRRSQSFFEYNCFPFRNNNETLVQLTFTRHLRFAAFSLLFFSFF